MIKDLARSILKIPLLEKIVVRYNTGRTYGTSLTKLTPNHYSYNSSSIRKVNRNGVNYELTISDIVDWSIYFGFKEIEKEKLLHLDPNPSTIIDVGANMGEISLRFAQQYPNAHIFSFEPHPFTFQKLQTNCSRNSFKNLTLLNLGLGSQKGEVHFEERASGNLGMNRVTSDREKSAHQIKVVPLDLFFEENKLSSLSIIKIDVEGYEHEVLKGASNVLSQYKPLLFIELDNDNLIEQGTSAIDLVKFIRSFGYQIEHGESGEPITENSNLEKSHFDIICRPRI